MPRECEAQVERRGEESMSEDKEEESEIDSTEIGVEAKSLSEEEEGK